MKEKILRSFIEYLKENHINYAILGNVQTYPNEIGGDVDIVLSVEHFKNIDQIVKSFCISSEFEICNQLQHEITAKYFVLSSIDTEKSQVVVLALDFCSDYMRQGRVILRANHLLKDVITIEQNNLQFNVCNNANAFIYYFIKKIEKKSIDNFQFEYLLNLWNSDRIGCQKELSLMFDPKDVLSITKLFDSGFYNDLTKDFLNKLSSETLSRFRVNPLNRLMNFIRLVKRILNPTGFVVAFYGCDGSGKSTLINKLMDETLEFQAFRSVSYHHLFPKRNNATKNAPVSNPHKQKPRSRVGSDLKLIYLFFHYFIGYWIIIYPQKIKSNLVIFDRYYFDILVDPKRYRHNGSEWLTKLIGWAIPKPDISIVIDANPEILQSRKQEVSFDESKRQRDKYLELNSIIESVTIVDNNDNVEKAYFDIKTTIFTECIKRYNKRN